ncbi:hypothetical protein [Telluribacter sp.]|jgi:DNA-binding LytR/AlgR family response regulator|uniref:hypothetical protein n=1 Tax=Telluribacter sp. TaxID=1978767 RepID=UPI002E1580A9|nr:hypothetical protein [Telluribacter sp.]
MIALKGDKVLYLVHPDTVELVEVEAGRTRLVTTHQTIVVDTDDNLEALKYLCGPEDLHELMTLPPLTRASDLPF